MAHISDSGTYVSYIHTAPLGVTSEPCRLTLAYFQNIYNMQLTENHKEHEKNISSLQEYSLLSCDTGSSVSEKLIASVFVFCYLPDNMVSHFGGP
jgi:hypothetical protein